MDARTPKIYGPIVKQSLLLMVMALLPLSTIAEPLHAGRLSAWKKAISNGHADTLSNMLVETPNIELVSTRAASGKTALMIACKFGRVELVNKLLDLGADVNATTNSGGTPFMFASLGGHLNIMQLLWGRKVDIDAKGTNGWSAMTIAAAKGYTEIISYLISIDAAINAQDIYRWTPLMRAVDNQHTEAVRVFLQEPRIELNHQDEAGNTALHHAVKGGVIEIMSLLLKRGADKSVRNSANFDATQLAEALPNADKVLALLSAD